MSTVQTIRPLTLTEAYSYARMSDTCPNCGAGPADWCRRPDGRYRRTPCLKRMRRRKQCAEHASDFSEPLRGVPR
jgi:hypothetical protein